MDLNSILEKTKDTSDKVKRTRTPVLIATEDRPYESYVSPLDFKINEKINPNLPNKIESNEIESDFKVASKVTSNCLQSDFKVASKVTSNYLQSDFNKTESDFKVASKVTSKVTSNCLQSDFKVTSNRSFYTLTGVQKNLMILIFEACRKSLSKITDPLSIDLLSKQLNCPKKTVKTCTYRLEKRKFLHRIEYKDGRGGWTKYQLPTDIYHEIMQYETDFKLTSKWLQTDFKLTSEVTSEVTSTPPSSSSIYINTTTTTELPDDWQKIDISGLESVGFSTHHLLQLYRTGIKDIAMIQDSIHHFAYDLSHNQKAKEIKTNAIAYFMGTMKKVGVYTPPDNYESEQTRGMRIYLEQKKKQQEKQLAIENELIDLSYNDWVKELSEEEKRSLIPETIANGKLEGAKLAALRSHFKKNIWPARSTIILKKLEEVS